MVWKDRRGNIVPGDDGQDRLLETLYGAPWGRALVGILVQPWVSHLAGRLLDSPLSAAAVAPFRKKKHIDMQDFAQEDYPSFNAFFTRHLREGARPIDMEPEHLIAPCDSKLTVWPIREDSRFTVKGVEYTLAQLLRDEKAADAFRGGTLLLFRLTVGDYHRYCYFDSGYAGANVQIPGFYHTVNPAASGRLPVYRENTREYCLMETEHFGRALQMEVGAAMVGRIVNFPGERNVCRGEEKGRFEFGGSTVIVCLGRDAAVIDPDILKNTAEDCETVVRMGEKIGVRK